MLSVLITCAGGNGKQNLFDSIRNNPDNEPVKIITCDVKNYDLLKHQSDGFYIIPKSDNQNFINTLYDICLKEKIDVILSSNEDECYTISKNLDIFKSIGTHATVNIPKSYEDTDYKHKTFNDLHDKIDVPKYHVATTFSEYQQSNIQKKCLKPSRRSITGGARGFRVIDDSISAFNRVMKLENNDVIDTKTVKDFFDYNIDLEPMLIMEYLPGDKYTAAVFSHNGHLESISINHLRSRESELSTDCDLGVTHDKIKRYCEIIVKQYNLDYCSIIEFKESYNGDAKFIEINPRIGSSTALTWQLGLNHPYMAIKKALGENFLKYNSTPKGRCFRYWTEESFY